MIDDSKISFWQTLNLNKFDNRKINLVFHNNWKYVSDDNEEQEMQINLGKRDREFDLFRMYQNGERKRIEFMTTLRGSVKKPRLYNNEIVFSFIPYAYGNRNWLLVAAFETLDAKNITVSKRDLREYTPYIGRLVVTYKEKGANLNLKDPEKIKRISVSDILSLPADRVFLGYDKVRLSYDELSGIIDTPEWSEKLKAKKGIYLITDTQTGKLYVGSAYGKNGIYGRWKTYIDSKGTISEVSDGVRYPNK